MNKYASGYALIQFLSAVGWIVIVVSAFGGLFIGFTAPRDMGWTGLLVAFAGGFQGLLLLGISALGTAVLDGSVAQQELLSKQVSTKAVPSTQHSDSKVEELLRLILGNSLGKPGMLFHEQFMGITIFKSSERGFVANDASFETLDLARDGIAKKNASGSDESGDFVTIGAYKIPRINGYYLMRGIAFESIEKLQKWIEIEIANGNKHQLSKYLI